MHLFYLDGSAEGPYTNFTAIGVPEESWRQVFSQVKAFRQHLKADYGVLLSKELHAWKFLSGRGRPAGPTRFVSLELRARIFNEALALLASFAPLDVKIICSAVNNEDWAFERVLNRINTCMRKGGSNALLICDEGKEGHFTRLCRRVGAFNPVPSKFGQWGNGKAWKSIPTEHILEDPVFKQSDRSNFIQLADFCAYALLRMDRPTPPMSELGIHKSFVILEPICVKDANKKDPYGVSR